MQAWAREGQKPAYRAVASESTATLFCKQLFFWVIYTNVFICVFILCSRENTYTVILDHKQILHIPASQWVFAAFIYFSRTSEVWKEKLELKSDIAKDASIQVFHIMGFM